MKTGRYLLLLALLWLPLLSFAQNKIQYVVKEGDTMASIAAEHGVTEQDIRRENGDNADMLFPGLVLTIPKAARPATGNNGNNGSGSRIGSRVPSSATPASGGGMAVVDKVVMQDSSYVLCKVESATASFVTVRQEGMPMPVKLAVKDVAYVEYANGTVKRFNQPTNTRRRRR